LGRHLPPCSSPLLLVLLGFMSVSAADVPGLTVVQLRAELRARGLPVSGNKAPLQARLLAALEAGDSDGDGGSTRKRPLGSIEGDDVVDLTQPEHKRAKTQKAPTVKELGPQTKMDGLYYLARGNNVEAVRARAEKLEREHPPRLRWELNFAEQEHELDYGDWGASTARGEYDTYHDNALINATRCVWSEMVRVLLHFGADPRLTSRPSGIDGPSFNSLSVALDWLEDADAPEGAEQISAKYLSVHLRPGMRVAELEAGIRDLRKERAQRETIARLLRAAGAFFPDKSRNDGQGRSAYSTEFVTDQRKIAKMKREKGLSVRRDGEEPTSVPGLRAALAAVPTVASREAAGEFADMELTEAEKAHLVKLEGKVVALDRERREEVAENARRKREAAERAREIERKRQCAAAGCTNKAPYHGCPYNKCGRHCDRADCGRHSQGRGGPGTRPMPQFSAGQGASQYSTGSSGATLYVGHNPAGAGMDLGVIGATAVAFGKHAGKTFDQVIRQDPQYARWAIGAVASGGSKGGNFRQFASYAVYRL
jgi:SAP domain